MPTQLSTLWRRIRGIYPAGGYEVTVKHWWSRDERQSARLAAKLIAHEAPRIDAEVRRRITESMIYGAPLIYREDMSWRADGPDWPSDVPPPIA